MTKLPDKMSLDNGYISGADLKALDKAKVDAHTVTGRDEKRSSDVWRIVAGRSRSQIVNMTMREIVSPVPVARPADA
jgi:hypothetical protein